MRRPRPTPTTRSTAPLPKTEDGKTTDFAYLGLSDKVVSEEIAGQLQRTYQYNAHGQRLSQIKKDTDGAGPEVAEDSHYGYNAHTDVETLTKDSGDTRATYGYTAYGNDDKEPSPASTSRTPGDPGKEPFNFYRFNGKRFDPASGSYDMGFRDYNPGLNRFLTRDSYNGALADLNLGTDPFTGNRYAFAGGNPITGIEADGHGLCADTECRYVCSAQCSNSEANALSERMASDRAAEEKHHQEQTDRWVAEYEKAIDDLPAKYKAREILSDPAMMGSPTYELVIALADEKFCERVGNDCANPMAFSAVGAATTVVSIWGLGKADPAGAESTRLIKNATDRVLAGGWQKLLDENLSDEEKRTYNDNLKNGRYFHARGQVGQAVHNAVAKELERAHPGRFEYNKSKGPDFRDRQNPNKNSRIELTTERWRQAHVDKGGLYRRVPYVLYRGPSVLSPIAMRNKGQ